MPKVTPDLVAGSQYGNWVVIEERPRAREKYYLCQCKCGLIREISKCSLRKGDSKSCGKGGCKAKPTNTTHDMSNTKLYRVWAGMHCRIRNPKGNSKCYIGLTVAPEWQDFQVFHDWAMGNGYEEGLTIDRIKTDIGYFPTNCRWVTWIVQSQNRRKHNVSKKEPKGVYLRKPRNVEVIYEGTHKAPYYWIVIYKGIRYQKSGFVTAIEAYKDRCNFIKENFDGLVYPD